MVTRLDRIILKAADPLNNTPAAYGVTELERLPNGRDIDVPMRDIDAVELAAIAEGFSLDVLKENSDLKAEVASLNLQLEAALTQVRQFEDGIWDRRMIDPGAWYARLSMDQVLAITKLSSVDPVAEGFVDALNESRQLRKADPAYRMSLDHPNAQQGVAYMQANGVFTKEQADTLLADSRRDEQ